jgi:hypothetical protein
MPIVEDSIIACSIVYMTARYNKGELRDLNFYNIAAEVLNLLIARATFAPYQVAGCCIKNVDNV